MNPLLEDSQEKSSLFSLKDKSKLEICVQRTRTPPSTLSKMAL